MKRLVTFALIVSVQLACASRQAIKHPNLSPVGIVVANVNTLDDATLKVQGEVTAFVTLACGTNQTSTCQAAQIGAAVMRTTKLIGSGSVAVGDAFKAYLAAKNVTDQLAAKSNLLEKIATLQSSGAQLVSQFQAVSSDVKDVSANIANLIASTKKGL